jgi:hypothetical protein
MSELHFEPFWFVLGFVLGFAGTAVVCRVTIGRWWP